MVDTTVGEVLKQFFTASLSDYCFFFEKENILGEKKSVYCKQQILSLINNYAIEWIYESTPNA